MNTPIILKVRYLWDLEKFRNILGGGEGAGIIKTSVIERFGSA